MADAASRWFKDDSKYETDLPDTVFLPRFNAAFPIPQGASWKRFHFSSKMITRVISELVGPPLSMASWMRITKRGGSFGKTGVATLSLLTPVPISTIQEQIPSSYLWGGERVRQGNYGRGKAVGVQQAHRARTRQ
eukprot:scaffold290901_cov28-Attheya_sp.AAC.1